MAKTLDILGVEVKAVTGAEAIRLIDTQCDRGIPVKLAYLNSHTSNTAAQDPTFAAALREFWVLNDGVGLDVAATLLHGTRFPENLNGTDFTVRYLQETSRTWRIFLLGAKPGVAELAGQHLARLASRHCIAGVQHGYFKPQDAGAIANTVRDSGADLILVALGNPQQEKWIAQYGEATGARLMVGVGALFDFLSGNVSRAPEWIRATRSEWVYRLALEPRRLARRYLLGNPYFLARVLRKRLVATS